MYTNLAKPWPTIYSHKVCIAYDLLILGKKFGLRKLHMFIYMIHSCIRFGVQVSVLLYHKMAEN